MKKIKVKFIKAKPFQGRIRQIGEVVEMAEPYANLLIAHKWAEPFKEAPTPETPPAPEKKGGKGNRGNSGRPPKPQRTPPPIPLDPPAEEKTVEQEGAKEEEVAPAVTPLPPVDAPPAAPVGETSAPTTPAENTETQTGQTPAQDPKPTETA